MILTKTTLYKLDPALKVNPKRTMDLASIKSVSVSSFEDSVVVIHRYRVCRLNAVIYPVMRCLSHGLSCGSERERNKLPSSVLIVLPSNSKEELTP